MNNQCIIFVGVQASGKSTFYNKYFTNYFLRLSMDVLKTRHRERTLLKACLDSKSKFVIDNTNPTIEDRKYYIDLINDHKFDYTIECYYFVSSLKNCLDRNRLRSKIPGVPEIAIYSTHGKLKIPTYEEGFNSIHDVFIDDDNEGNFITNLRRRD